MAPQECLVDIDFISTDASAVVSLVGEPLVGEVVSCLSPLGYAVSTIVPMVRSARRAQWSFDTREVRRRAHRVRQRAALTRPRRLPVTEPIGLAVLDGLDVPGSVPWGRQFTPVSGVARMVASYYPDGSVIDGTFNRIVTESRRIAAGSSDRCVVARSTLHRRGVRLLVVTTFTVVDYAYDGPPVLWVTRVYQQRRGCAPAAPPDGHTWRYSSREAALAGHRRVVQALGRSR